MKTTTLLCMLILLGLAVISPSTLIADDNKPPTSYGVRTGLGINPDQFVVGAQAVFGRALKIARIAPSADIGFGDNATVITLNTDLRLMLFSPPESSVEFYCGAGPTIALISPKGGDNDTEIGLTLAMDPTLVLLDEPTAGMSRGEAQEIVALLQTISRDVTIVLIEHDIDIVFKLSDRITVMTAGRVLADGSPSEIEQNESVQEAYFGGVGQGE